MANHADTTSLRLTPQLSRDLAAVQAEYALTTASAAIRTALRIVARQIEDRQLSPGNARRPSTEQ